MFILSLCSPLHFALLLLFLHTPFLQSLIFDEVDLSDASVAESSTKNVNNSFTVSVPMHVHRHTRIHAQTGLISEGEITVSKNHSNNGNMVVGFFVNVEYYWRLFFCPCMFLFSYVLMSVWANRGIFMAWKDCFEDKAPRTSSVF